jgi:hypothetical protein
VIAISTRPTRTGERVASGLDLAPWEGVIVEGDA